MSRGGHVTKCVKGKEGKRGVSMGGSRRIMTVVVKEGVEGYFIIIDGRREKTEMIIASNCRWCGTWRRGEIEHQW